MARVVGLAIAAYGVYTLNAGAIWRGLGMLYTGASIVYGAEQAARAKRRARADYVASLEDRLEMVDVQAAAPRTLVLGRVRGVEGIRYPAWTSGTHGEKLTMIVGFAGHQIDAFEQFYLNDTPVTLDGNGWVQTAPYFKSRDVSHTQDSTSSVITLAHAPVSGSVSAIVATGEGDNTQNQAAVILSVVGSVVTLEPVSGGRYTVTYQAVEGTSTARIRGFTGAPGQNVGAAIAAEYPGKIDSTRQFQGMAVAVVDILYDTDVYVQGRPNVTAVMRGARCYDPRKDSTVPGGSGSHRAATPSTWEWTENPALHALRYAMWEHGWALPVADCLLADVVAAANVADTSTAFPVRTDGVLGTVTLPRYRCGIVISSDADPRAAMDDILQTMAGVDGWAGGLWRLKAGHVESAAWALDAGWLARSVGDDGTPADEPVVRITNGVPRDQRLTRVTGRCVDPASRYQMLAFPAVEDTVLTASRGLAVAEIDMPGVNSVVHAQHLAKVAIRQAQASMRLELRCNYRAWAVDLFDVGTLTLPRFSFAGNTVRCTGWRWHPAEGITLRLAETTAAVFTPVDELTGVDPAPNITGPDPRVVERITGVTVTSGTAPLTDGSVLTRTRIAWTAAAGENVRAGGAIEVQYTLAGEGIAPAWQSWMEDGASASATIPALLSGKWYLFRVRAISAPPLQVRGNWSRQVAHQVALPEAATITQFVFKRSDAFPLITGNGIPLTWSDTPPAPDGNPLWMSYSRQNAAGEVQGDWSTPVVLDGRSLQVQWSVDGVSGWHDEPANGDLWARYRYVGESTWSDPVRIGGEDGASGAYSLLMEVYQQSVTRPARPVGGSYTFTGDVFTAPSGWSRTQPDATGVPVWSSSVLFSTNDPDTPVQVPVLAASHALWQAISPAVWTLTESGRTAQVASGSGRLTAKASQSRSAGKRYVEFEILNDGGFTGPNDQVGLSRAPTAGQDPSDAGIGYERGGDPGPGFPSGTGGSLQIGGTTIVVSWYTTGDVIGFALDIDTGKVWVSRNGAWLAGDPAAGTSPSATMTATVAYTPVVTSDAGATCKVRLNADLSTFVHDVPSGFSGWSDDPLMWSTPSKVNDPAAADALFNQVGDTDTPGSWVTVGNGVVQEISYTTTYPCVAQVSANAITTLVSPDSGNRMSWVVVRAETGEETYLGSITSANARNISVLYPATGAIGIGETLLFRLVASKLTGNPNMTVQEAQMRLVMLPSKATILSGASGTDPNFSSVALLLLGNGSDGSSTIVDSGPAARTVATNLDVYIDAGRSKFGGASMRFPTPRAYLRYASSAAFNMPGDFTLEAWVYPTDTTEAHGIVNRRLMDTTATGTWTMDVYDGQLQWVNADPGAFNVVRGGTVPLNTWTHVAVCRSGSTIRLFVNGAQVNTYTDATNFSSSYDVHIGVHSAAGGTAPANYERFWNGNIDDLRLSPGVARYTSAFTPPAAQLPTS